MFNCNQNWLQHLHNRCAWNTPKKINDFIKSKYNDMNNNTPLYDDLLNFYIKYKKKEYKKLNKKNIDDLELASFEKMLEIYQQSYLYEPANIVKQLP
jgi:hypothetical protein